MAFTRSTHGSGRGRRRSSNNKSVDGKFSATSKRSSSVDDADNSSFIMAKAAFLANLDLTPVKEKQEQQQPKQQEQQQPKQQQQQQKQQDEKATAVVVRGVGTHVTTAIALCARLADLEQRFQQLKAMVAIKEAIEEVKEPLEPALSLMKIPKIEKEEDIYNAFYEKKVVEFPVQTMSQLQAALLCPDGRAAAKRLVRRPAAAAHLAREILDALLGPEHPARGSLFLASRHTVGVKAHCLPPEMSAFVPEVYMEHFGVGGRRAMEMFARHLCNRRHSGRSKRYREKIRARKMSVTFAKAEEEEIPSVNVSFNEGDF